MKRPQNDDRGATLVEMSIVGPVAFLFILAIMEFGLFFRDYISTSNAAGSGAQVASVMGNGQLADLEVLKEVRRSLGGVDLDQVERVVVFRPADVDSSLVNAADGTPEADCREGTPVAGLCNVYYHEFATGSAIFSPQAADYFQCGASHANRWWCPTTRDATLEGGTDLVGVLVVTNHDSITGIGPVDTEIMDEAIFQIEAEEF